MDESVSASAATSEPPASRTAEILERSSGYFERALPTGRTHHRLEEVLVGAALASAVTCVVLLTVGGFLG